MVRKPIDIILNREARKGNMVKSEDGTSKTKVQSRRSRQENLDADRTGDGRTGMESHKPVGE